MMPITEVPLADLDQEPIVEGHPHLDPERVAYYVEHLDESPPVMVYNIHGRLLLADGYHRVAAAQRLGRGAIRAEVHQGERGDALRFAVEHGKEQRGLSEHEIMEAIARRSRDQEPPMP
ncbi:ParB N-terminal domain-containing protein [Arthrobacter bambusae]|uniref:ParB N-terminal domain-containing protein n=1 Tax=Arthrobacter bambusae TaxID=1338426 RepID=UPI0027826B8A|nr:ParB N-terminal domain-containing protein [Arthrobacter bambusae]MDQ0029643.1 ParB-like chromosome segregation protein Spo0J [Arthrobacter bambusae]MDQ0097303.1 ParB-like chromosome segregation protein Spo0J [Arthrobacter bambusae]